MSTLELKDRVVKQLETVDDYLLKEILDIIELEHCKSKVLKIPVEHQKSIDIGLSQIDAGETLTNEEIDRNVQKWIGK